VAPRDERTIAEGFAIAAAAHDDPGGERASAGLSDVLDRRLRGVAMSLAASDRSTRRAFVREVLARRPHPALEQGGRSPRALSLLATSVERERGRAFLRAAPPPRSGYVPDPHLVATLRRLSALPVKPSRSGKT
jgi:hypothetical protein